MAVGCRARLVVSGLGVVLSLLGACSSSSSDRPEVRAAAVYESIVRWFADADGDDPEPLPLFVEPRGEGTEIALEVQAELVAAVQAVADVRFVDTRDEALAIDDVEPPVVVDDGLLVRLGPVNDRTRVVNVDVDVYDGRTGADGQLQFRTLEFLLVEGSDRWVISGEPEEVPPR